MRKSRSTTNSRTTTGVPAAIRPPIGLGARFCLDFSIQKAKPICCSDWDSLTNICLVSTRQKPRRISGRKCPISEVWLKHGEQTLHYSGKVWIKSAPSHNSYLMEHDSLRKFPTSPLHFSVWLYWRLLKCTKSHKVSGWFNFTMYWVYKTAESRQQHFPTDM
jgi:hypothetical protein